jgi:hypothetical protein
VPHLWVQRVRLKASHFASSLVRAETLEGCVPGASSSPWGTTADDEDMRKLRQRHVGRME